MDAPKAPEFRELARRLVHAARERDSEQTQDLVGQMRPHLARHVSAIVRRSPPPPGCGVSAEDVVQEVALRLLRMGLTRPPEHHDPELTVLSWVKTVTLRYLIDLRRKCRGQPRLAGPPPEGEGRAPEGAPIWTHLLVDALQTCLGQRYPRALPLFLLLREDPEPAGEEIAGRLGVSLANAYKIRSRMVRVLAECLEHDASSGRDQ
jgi:DNA-directed RNA polymerase specialized sigma24 family protein